MTLEQIDLVKTSFAKIEPEAETVADLFYTKLFELDPSLESLFTGDMREQGRKLMNMLGLAVRGLDRIDELGPAVRALGMRHAGYGVKEFHYELVATALLWTLEQGLGEEFNVNTREAWTSVYYFLAGEMKSSSRESLKKGRAGGVH